MSRVHFCATASDFCSTCETVDRKLTLSIAACARAPWRDDLAALISDRFTDVPGLGVLEDPNANPWFERYLALDRSVPLTIRKRHLGLMRYEAVLNASY